MATDSEPVGATHPDWVRVVADALTEREPAVFAVRAAPGDVRRAVEVAARYPRCVTKSLFWLLDAMQDTTRRVAEVVRGCGVELARCEVELAVDRLNWIAWGETRPHCECGQPKGRREDGVWVCVPCPLEITGRKP